MNTVDVNTVDTPVDPAGFNNLQTDNYPYCILGFQVKNLYDQTRLVIPQQYKPVNIIHKDKDNILYFRGVNVTPTPLLYGIINRLNSGYGSTNEQYVDILNEFSVTCSNCCHLKRDSVFPIDNNCIDTLIEPHIDTQQLYYDMLHNNDVPFYQSISYMSLFILVNKKVTLFAKKDTPQQ